MKLNFEFYNHYPAPISFEQNSLLAPLKKCLKYIAKEGLIIPDSVICGLENIELNLVDDATITQVHADFMNLPTPTDVITFHHGEIFISYDTAVREAEERNISIEEELFRYHLHGVLHLAGYDDLNKTDYTEMHALQEKLIQQYFS